MTKNQLIIKLLVLVFIPFLLGSCDSSKKYEKIEKEEIAAYLAANSATVFVKKPSGLYYHEVVVGTGVSAEVSDSAYVKYSASYLNGTVFESILESADTYAFAVGMGDVITGFDEAVSYMKVGGTSKFIVPSFLGYGNSGYYFYAYTPILYYVTLVDVMDMSPDK